VLVIYWPNETMTYRLFVIVQKRAAASLNWPNDLQGVTRVVELYVANDYSQVRVHTHILLYDCWLGL
jgi:hypothetical protein